MALNRPKLTAPMWGCILLVLPLVWGSVSFPVVLNLWPASILLLIVGLLLDRLVKQKQEMFQAKNELERSNTAQSRFLANMSHEVRTPLAGILGYSDQLLFDRDLKKEHRMSAESIKKCTHHLKFLLDDILDVSNIEAGKIIIHREPTNLMTLLHDVIGIMDGKIKEKKLSFEVIFSSLVPDRVLVDPLRVRQILINLLNNAMKFTDRGGITLGLSIKGFNDNRQGVLQLTITDTGRGIPLDFQPQLFKRFNQAESARKVLNRGSGLGLFLSRNLAVQLGGELKLVESTVGEGSTFVCTIAMETLADSLFVETFVYPQLNAEDLSLPNPIDGKLENLSILLVEDGIDNQRIFQHFLKMAGAHVVLAEDGRSALEQVSRDPLFDLILMDIQIPILDGLEVTRELRRLGYSNPIIAVTAHTIQGEKALAFAAGVSDFLSKPVDIEQLIQTIKFHSDGFKPKNEKKILSRYHGNLLYRELIVSFIQGMDGRVGAIQNTINRRDWDELSQSLHQIKGAAGTYGFPLLSVIAEEMEDTLIGVRKDVLAIPAIQEQMEGLRLMGNRMMQGLPLLALTPTL